jgi:hypothetical protein
MQVKMKNGNTQHVSDEVAQTLIAAGLAYEVKQEAPTWEQRSDFIQRKSRRSEWQQANYRRVRRTVQRAQLGPRRLPRKNRAGSV